MDTEKIKCNKCNEMKILDEFYYNKQYAKKRKYRSSMCITCAREYHAEHKRKIKKNKEVISNEDIKDELFQRIGYDTSKNISEQFLKKYNL